MSETEDTGDLPLFERLKSWVREDRHAASKQYDEIRRDFGFYAGGEAQWEPEDIIALDAANKPHASFNFIMPSVSAVVGMEVSNRQEVTYLPRTTQTAAQPAQAAPGILAGGPGGGGSQPVPGANDQGPAELLTAGAQYFRDQCDAEDEESDAFQDTAICGMGWTETRVDYEEEANGKMIVDRCDPCEMGWDCRAQKRNLVDARRFHRVRQLDRRAALDMFPGYDLEEIDAAWARPQHIDTEPHDREAARNYENDTTPDGQGKLVTVVEITWFDTERKHTVANLKTGEVLRGVDGATVKKLRERYKKIGHNIAVTTQKTRIYRQAFLGASEILAVDGDDENGTLCQSQKGFKFGCMTGTRDRNNKQWMGITRAMRDPQRWANALYSSTLYTVMTSGKGIMAERDAFESPNDAEAGWAQQDKIVFLKTGALSGPNPKVMPKVPSALPPGIDKLMEFAIAAMRGVSGVNLETLGATDRDQAASLEYQRRQAATTILAPFFDGLRRYRKGRGRVMLDLINKYLSDGRLIRIAGPDYEQYVPLVRDENVTEYDIIVAESPTSPNQKEAQWGITQSLLPVVGKNLGPNATAALLKASPLSESTVKEFRDAVKQDQADVQNAPPPPEVQLTMAQIEKTKAETALKGVDAQQKQIEIAATLQTAQMDMRDREAERLDKAAAREHEFRMRDMEGRQAQERHGMEMAAKSSEMRGVADQEFAKAAGADMPAQFAALTKGLMALGQGIENGMVALAKSQAELAKMIAAPRQTDLIYRDGMPVASESRVVNGAMQ
jgi:hypothetical protein